MKNGSLFQKIVLLILTLGGIGFVAGLWILLPPHPSNISLEGKAERARQLELIMTEANKQKDNTEDASDSTQAQPPPEQAKKDASVSSKPAKTNGQSPVGSVKKDTPPPVETVALDPMVKMGMKVYKEFECFNCHKLGGKGWKKRKGPELDNIGNLVSAELLKKKLLDPWVFSTEGFDKEYQKPVMPNNYPKLMSDKEMDAVVAYMLTLKNPSAKTPKPIFDPKRPDS